MTDDDKIMTEFIKKTMRLSVYINFIFVTAQIVLVCLTIPFATLFLHTNEKKIGIFLIFAVLLINGISSIFIKNYNESLIDLIKTMKGI